MMKLAALSCTKYILSARQSCHNIRSCVSPEEEICFACLGMCKNVSIQRKKDYHYPSFFLCVNLQKKASSAYPVIDLFASYRVMC